VDKYKLAYAIMGYNELQTDKNIAYDKDVTELIAISQNFFN
jgi:hypothetical protein